MAIVSLTSSSCSAFVFALGSVGVGAGGGGEGGLGLRAGSGTEDCGNVGFELSCGSNTGGEKEEGLADVDDGDDCDGDT